MTPSGELAALQHRLAEVHRAAGPLRRQLADLDAEARSLAEAIHTAQIPDERAADAEALRRLRHPEATTTKPRRAAASSRGRDPDPRP